MKKYTLIIAVILLGFTSCKNNSSQSDTQFTPVKGAVIDSMQMPIVEDSLNKSVFSIKVSADSAGRNGVYQVNSMSGANAAVDLFTMPKGAEKYKPLIRKKSPGYVYIIGFHIPNDTTFYEYYQVSSDNSAITMRYIKSYTFQ